MVLSAADARLRAALREEVRRWAAACGTRRRLPTLVHVGALGGERVTLPHLPAYDVGLRRDLLTRLLDATPPGAAPTVWLTRGGVTVVGDADLDWLAAATAACGRHGIATGFHVVTRRGWLDVRTGETRVWCRVRTRAAGA